MDIVVKGPGSIHESRIFYNSKVNEMLKDGIIPSMPKVIVEDASPVPICILGDPAYPRLPFLMKEVPGRGNTVQKTVLWMALELTLHGDGVCLRKAQG